MSAFSYHHYDLPYHLKAESVAIDTEAMGLKYHRDRLCVVQVSTGDGKAYVVHFPKADFSQSPYLRALLTNDDVQKIFHFARFDVTTLQKAFDINLKKIYCTKIASKLVRTYTERHGLKELCKELLSIDLSKQEQLSDWGAEKLTHKQIEYAGRDVLHLHKLKEILDERLVRENRENIAKACFEFLPYRAKLDLMGDEHDIFSHSSV